MVLCTVPVSAQFLNIQIDVDPEVETLVEQNLDFGLVVAGSGFQPIPPGSPAMGVFRIRALRTQRLLISLEADEALVHADPAINDRIPIELQASYTPMGVRDFELSTPMTSILESVVLESPPDNPEASWTSLFIFIYGGLDVGNIAEGIYTGEVILTVIYE